MFVEEDGGVLREGVGGVRRQRGFGEEALHGEVVTEDADTAG